MSDTGLQKVAEGLKAALVPAKWVKDNEYRQGYRQAIAETLDSVLRLIEEEKAQKPSALSEVVMEIKMRANKYGRARDMFVEDCHNILSRYRPTPLSEEGFGKELRRFLERNWFNMKERTAREFDDILSRRPSPEIKREDNMLTFKDEPLACPHKDNCGAKSCKGCRFARVEPLAALAERKGYKITKVIALTDPILQVDEKWNIWLKGNAELGPDGTLNDQVFYASVYHESESKARQYLNGLPDKGKK